MKRYSGYWNSQARGLVGKTDYDTNTYNIYILPNQFDIMRYSLVYSFTRMARKQKSRQII